MIAWTGNTVAQEKLSDEDILKLYDGLRVADVADGGDDSYA